jgi:integrase
VLQALSAHLAEFPAGPDGLDFTNEKGHPVSRNRAGHLWRKAAAKAELPEDANGWHALRHFYASALIRAGLSVKEVQKRLGHESAKTTLDAYPHLWPSDEDRTRSAVEAALAVPVQMSGTEAAQDA